MKRPLISRRIASSLDCCDRKRLVEFVFLLMALVAAPACSAPAKMVSSDPPMPAMGSVINIRVRIDGRSRLILKGDTAQWFHLDYAAPGRLSYTKTPTQINGVDWYPTWPDAPDSENRFCNCLSNVFSPVAPGVPSQPSNISLQPIQVRNRAAIVEFPTAANGFKLVIEFDDDPPGGDALYEVNVVVAS
jgi:hypothetical protein